MSSEAYIKETVKKAAIVMAQVWGIGQRKFRESFHRRMEMFKSLVKSIILYAAEIWSWREEERAKKLQEKYIRWTLGLDFNIPAYLIREETKTEKIRIEAKKRAVRYEEKTRSKRTNKIITECWKEIDVKQEKKKLKWEKKREEYCSGKGIDREGLRERRAAGRELSEALAEVDRAKQKQEQKASIKEGRFFPKYKELRIAKKPKYLEKEYQEPEDDSEIPMRK
ncbi:hypothetical protein RF55_16494 [Lasius niger]|uniref:Uncharacterized protein n=1 Tax=Lasius niger TaxID=67767 RepID=A0A0J7K4C2_LASNI|nr:hypothetical protein RF55_16494 [Lasius niger]